MANGGSACVGEELLGERANNPTMMNGNDLKDNSRVIRGRISIIRYSLTSIGYLNELFLARMDNRGRLEGLEIRYYMGNYSGNLIEKTLTFKPFANIYYSVI